MWKKPDHFLSQTIYTGKEGIVLTPRRLEEAEIILFPYLDGDAMAVTAVRAICYSVGAKLNLLSCTNHHILLQICSPRCGAIHRNMSDSPAPRPLEKTDSP